MKFLTRNNGKLVSLDGKMSQLKQARKERTDFVALIGGKERRVYHDSGNMYINLNGNKQSVVLVGNRKPQRKNLFM